MSEQDRLELREDKAVACIAYLKSKMSKDELRIFFELYKEAGLTTFAELMEKIIK